MKYLIIILFTLISSNLYSSSVYNVRVNDSKYKINALNHYGNDLISANQISKYLLSDTKYNAKEYSFEGSDFIIKFVPGVVFIVKENWLGKSVTQLELPVLSMNKNFYFPIKSFIYSLDSLHIYNVLAGEGERHFLLVNEKFSGLTALPEFKSIPEKDFEAENNFVVPKSKLPKISDKNSNAIIFSNNGDGTKININQNEPFKKSFLNIHKKLNKALESIKPDEFKPSDVNSNKDLKINNDKKNIDNNPELQYNLPQNLQRKELLDIKNRTPN